MSTQAVLPQYDTDPNARYDALVSAREEYRYDYEINPPLAMSADVPKADKASKGWSQKATEVMKAVAESVMAADKELGHTGARRLQLKGLTRMVSDLFHGDFQTALNDFLALLEAGSVAGTAGSIEDFSTFFKTLGVPEIAKTFTDDGVFAYQAVAGGNPTLIERVTALTDFPVTDTMLRAATGNGEDSLDTAIAAGRLYIADYAMLDGVPLGTYDEKSKYIYAPKALYAVPIGKSLLVPVAIQIEQKPAPDNPVITPAEDMFWQIAKTFVSVADACVSALYFHHARTHLLIEPIVVATHRQLAPNHPLYRLMTPHFEGTLNINDLGQKLVLSKHGFVDTVAAPTHEASRAFAVAGVTSLKFNESSLPDQLKARGVDDTQALPTYPWRDDALLLWDAIRTWVDGYIRHYYPSDADVQNDNELQAWLAELLSPDGGAMAHIGEAGRMRTVDYLVEAVTRIVFTASPKHWSLNFPLKASMAFVPNMPLAAYRPRPVSGEGLTREDWLETLPPLDQAQRQFDAAYVMGALMYTTLGQYPEGQFVDEAIQAKLSAFQADLRTIDATIEERNLSRPPYPYMAPATLPQSIHI